MIIDSSIEKRRALPFPPNYAHKPAPPKPAFPAEKVPTPSARPYYLAYDELTANATNSPASPMSTDSHATSAHSAGSRLLPPEPGARTLASSATLLPDSEFARSQPSAPAPAPSTYAVVQPAPLHMRFDQDCKHDLRTRYGSGGLVLSVICFPIGLVALLYDQEKECRACGLRTDRQGNVLRDEV